MNKELYDLIILGGGPAGLTAGIYATRARLKTLIIERERCGGLITKTQQVLNYPGLYGVTGEELGEKFEYHAREMGVEFTKDAIREIKFESEIKILKSKRNEYRAKTVLIATGTRPRTLGIRGEQELVGSGVAYCATCDAEFFKDKKVFVVGSGDQAIEESFLIAKYASEVKIIVIHDENILDCNKLSAQKALNYKKFKFIWNSTIEEIIGEDKVEGVKIKNLKNNTIEIEKCDGVFLFVGMIPNTELFKDIVELDKKGYIEINEKYLTSQEGVYAAGDITNKSKVRQVITSSAEGAMAAIEISKFLEEK